MDEKEKQINNINIPGIDINNNQDIKFTTINVINDAINDDILTDDIIDDINRYRNLSTETINTTSIKNRNNKSNSITSITDKINYLNVNHLNTYQTVQNLTLQSPQLSYVSMQSPPPVYSKSSLLSPLPIYSNASETRMGSIDLTGQHHSLIDRNCDGLSRSFIDHHDDDENENENGKNNKISYNNNNYFIMNI